ncbi:MULTISPECIES: hypothetical protein [Alcanivorax]|jgi:hypothetical protein|uniref:hypothetical protein n=1 Tax=Alcanivorax TaxID=59753 RepID=UPI000C6A828A|nr:hypothetical protein [Alcanivorax jadensis]MBG31785.1 hypothetical protein [Alcanivorax sp.]MDF1637101.1 hypothetical protein [Alcanivorax jadensis]|tara:strand:- start:6100 stop:6753 length:654 start_codon:yes stop_codon:yes gene_type:complete
MKTITFTVLSFLCFSAQARDLIFEGEIRAANILPIEMIISCDWSSGEKREGRFLYKNTVKEIGLSGFVTGSNDDEGSYLILGERSDGNVDGVFALKWEAGSNILGKWTDFESIYPVILFPVKYRIFESDASYSAHEFRLDAVAYSYENSNLYLSFGGNKEIPVGTIPNCDHDGNVEYAWLEMQSDETYDFTIREVFTGIPGERLREFKFDKNGRRIK